MPGTTPSVDVTGVGGGGGEILTPLPAATDDVGYGPMPRLNRTQYQNTIRDLLSPSKPAAGDFPNENAALGFDTSAAAQRLSPLHVEVWMNAAEELITELLARDAADPVRQRYIACNDLADPTCQLDVLQRFATKAWRRPVAAAELVPYQALASGSGEAGLSAALQAMLLSPKFIFRIEADPNPEDATPHAVSAHELATRISYFLEATTPTDELRALADDGTLLDPNVAQNYVASVLKQPERAAAFVDTVGTQWLDAERPLEMAEIGYFEEKSFPEYDADLGAAMSTETKLFMAEFVGGNSPAMQLLTANFSFLNQRLAEHYGVEGVVGAEFRRVDFVDGQRGGLLGQGSFLTSTSNPSHTSPVKRGKYVLEKFLCSSPPPPPPGIDLQLEAEAVEAMSLRDELLAHQAKGPICAGCHVVMDPVGLAFENYDAIGRYRTEDEYGVIDASGQVPDGAGMMQSFTNADELANLYAADPRTLPCLTRNLLTFSLGRSFNARRALSEQVVEAAQQNGGSLKNLIAAIVSSDPFRFRRAATQVEAGNIQ